MDPQQRLLLETVWQAVEDAGYRPSELAGKRVGVFRRRHQLRLPRGAAGRRTLPLRATPSPAPSLSIVPNRVSYLLDLRGPSIAAPTARPGSLTAVHQACAAPARRHLRPGHRGRRQPHPGPAFYEALSQGEMLSPDGRCKAFDSRADGYVRGEGAGVVLPAARAGRARR